MGTKLLKLQNENIYEKIGSENKSLVVPAKDEDYEGWTKRWECVSYEGKTFDEEAPEIYTDKGERVRSKSEKMIADKLKQLNIPYRYEYPLKLQGFGIVYSDFTILDIKWEKIKYMEHFGRMDDPQYAQKAVKKIQLYAKHNIVLGRNLIIAMETSNTPLDMRMVERLFVN